MGKKNKGAAAKVAALTPEEFQKLTPDQQVEYLNNLQEANANLESEKAELAASLKEVKTKELPTIEVDEDEKRDIEGGKYQFAYPTFTWDDGNIINVNELASDMESEDEKVAAKASLIVIELLTRKSGVLLRKED